MKIAFSALALLAVCCTTTLLAAPVTVGGDGNGSYGGATDTASNVLIIGGQDAVETENPSETYDLSDSTFNFFASPNVAQNRTATPFIALFAGGDVNDLNNYDVVAVGDPVTVTPASANSSLSVPFQAAVESLIVNAGETIVGGFYATGDLPIGFGGGPADSSPILLIGNASELNDITLTGTNHSGNDGVTNRIYDFDINLQVIPEPSSLAAFVIVGLAGCASCFHIRRRRK